MSMKEAGEGVGEETFLPSQNRSTPGKIRSAPGRWHAPPGNRRSSPGKKGSSPLRTDPLRGRFDPPRGGDRFPRGIGVVPRGRFDFPLCGRSQTAGGGEFPHEWGTTCMAGKAEGGGAPPWEPSAGRRAVLLLRQIRMPRILDSFRFFAPCRGGPASHSNVWGWPHSLFFLKK